MLCGIEVVLVFRDITNAGCECMLNCLNDTTLRRIVHFICLTQRIPRAVHQFEIGIPLFLFHVKLFVCRMERSRTLLTRQCLIFIFFIFLQLLFLKLVFNERLLMLRFFPPYSNLTHKGTTVLCTMLGIYGFHVHLKLQQICNIELELSYISVFKHFQHCQCVYVRIM